MAEKIVTLISQHKKTWIDQAVFVRHLLIHPEKGKQQLMFHLEFAQKYDRLVCKKVTPPEIDSLPIDKYAEKVLNHAKEFSSEFIGLLQG